MKIYLKQGDSIVIQKDDTIDLIDFPIDGNIPDEAIFEMKDDIVYDQNGNVIEYEGIYEIVMLEDVNKTNRTLFIIFACLTGLCLFIFIALSVKYLLLDFGSLSKDYEPDPGREVIFNTTPTLFGIQYMFGFLLLTVIFAVVSVAFYFSI